MKKAFRYRWIAPIALAIVIASHALAAVSEHPGNIFVAGESVEITVPQTWAGWRAIDDEGKAVGQSAEKGSAAVLGKLPVGFYELHEQDGPGLITAGVVATNNASEDTPIALDAAMSWFYQDPKVIADASHLCQLAGVKWVRDRLVWPEIEVARDKWADETRYERSFKIQHDAGLKVLQVNHVSPEWSTKKQSRFPEDLRDVYSFYKGLAARWKGTIDAIEPWNEPDIDVFGGHTGCEIASFQKAAYLGLKAGNPELITNGTVFAIDRAETLDEFGANEVYPYFDRYDLHHYIRLNEYSRAYGRHRAVSGGRPMWTTEFNLTVHWADEKTKEPSYDELRVQGYRVGKVFSQALFEGSQKAFYFILGDYVERELQYGIIHQDLTPRPAYIAFAAVGRLLNDAVPIGRVDFGDEKLKGYLFATQVDGQKRETLVAWSETKPTTVDLSSAEKIYDYLGREMSGGKIELSRATIFAVLPPGGVKNFKVEPPPVKPPFLEGKATPVVLQLIGDGAVKQSAFVIDASKSLRLVMYNFSDQPARGTLSVDDGSVNESAVELMPGERKEIPVAIAADAKTVTARLDAGALGKSIVSARVVASPAATTKSN